MTDQPDDTADLDALINAGGDGGGPGGIGMGSIASLVNDPSTVADLLTETSNETGDSPADVLADLINEQRLDTWRLAKHHGVECEIHKITPERVADLLAGVITGEWDALLTLFVDEADRRERVLRAVLEDDEFGDYARLKLRELQTADELPEGVDD